MRYTVRIYCSYEFLRVKSNSLSGTNSWSVAETNGALVQGGYGHSSVYDSSSHSIYVLGGYKALPANKYGLVDHLYRYQVHTHTWWVSILCTCNTMKSVCACVSLRDWLIISASAPQKKNRYFHPHVNQTIAHMWTGIMSLLSRWVYWPRLSDVWNMTAVTNKLVVTL